MAEWLSANADVISAAASIGMLAIWAVYLNIFWRSHRRQRTPMLVINRGEGRELSARCFVTNMSQEAVYVQSVVADLITPRKRHRAYITDAEDLRDVGSPTGWQHMTRQGPLGSGKLVDMGSFECILDYAVQVCAGEDRFAESALGRETYACEITIVGIYGSEDLLIGACRCFEIERCGEALFLRATRPETKQITSPRERRRLASEIAEQL